MFQTSFDGGDIASITSGFDNEYKRPIAGILKTKRNSIKKKVQNFSLELDDAVIEPLLQKDKDSTEIGSQSAKYLLSKTKTDSIIEKGDDKDKLLADKKSSMPSMTSVPSVSNNAHLVNGTNSVKVSIKSNGSTITPINNHMNTNVFNNNDALHDMSSPKTQILVQIEATKLSGYSPSSLIFTTAKIHTNGKSKQMEPVQVTPVPIVSTIEGNVIKTGALTNYTPSTKDTFRGNNEQNIRDNIFSKNQVPFSHITHKTTSDVIAKPSSVKKVITTISTLVQVSQSPNIIDVKVTDVKNIPSTTTINITPSALFKSEPSTKTSLAQNQETAKSTTVTEHTESALENTTALMYNTQANNSSASGINITDNITKVIEMDINKNIQSPKSTTSPVPGTSIQVDSSCKTIYDPSGTDRIARQISSSLSNKKLESHENETVERSFESDSKQSASNSNKSEKASLSKGNSDRNTTPNKSNSFNLKPSVAQSTAKLITPSTVIADSSVVSSISCSKSSQAQSVAITKGLPVSLAKSLTTNDTMVSTNAVEIITTNANTNASKSDKTPSVSTHTTNSASTVSKSFIMSTAKSPAVSTASQLSNTETDTKISIAKPLNTSTPVSMAVAVKMTTTGSNSNVTSTITSQPIVGTKSTCSVSPAVSKPSTLSTANTLVITPQSTIAACSASSKSTVTSVKSTATPRMAQSSTTRTVAGSAFSTATKPSTVTTMKSSAGQKINTSSISKPTTPKSPASVVSTSSTTKNVSKERNEKKASDGFSKHGKSSKA